MIVKISIIIPVLNEASHIADTLATVVEASNVEVIVVDGGSHDETVAIAQSLGAKIIAAGTGRASQMNAGAAVATGDILLFLHALRYFILKVSMGRLTCGTHLQTCLPAIRF